MFEVVLGCVEVPRIEVLDGVSGDGLRGELLRPIPILDVVLGKLAQVV